jgi:inorganic pyrophosphatase
MLPAMADSEWTWEPVEQFPVPVDEWFWMLADELVGSSEIVIDRPQRAVGVDYGYLTNTTSIDGEGVDVWRGSLPDTQVTGAIMTVDVRPDHRDAEVKLLVGCTPAEAQAALEGHRGQHLKRWPRPTAAILVMRPVAGSG